MKVIGIDPGIERLGYAVIGYQGGQYHVQGYGMVHTSRKYTLPERLKTIYEEISLLMDCYKPDMMVLEEIVFAKNVTTAMTISEVRGVVLLLSAQKGLLLEEIGPTQLKRALCGNGRATKSQIQRSVQKFLGLAELPQPDDVADALALALVGLTRPVQRQKKEA